MKKIYCELYEGIGLDLNGRHIWCLNNSISLLVRFSIKDEAMDVARFAPHWAHYHADVSYLLPSLGIRKGTRVLCYSELSLHQLSSRPTIVIPRWTTHPCILYQVCTTCGSIVVA